MFFLYFSFKQSFYVICLTFLFFGLFITKGDYVRPYLMVDCTKFNSLMFDI
ncbi:hypothetical protein CsatB_027029 [Cannabis sativa]